MDIALRKDLIDIQELIANPPASCARRARLERRQLRRGGGSPLDLPARLSKNNNNKSANLISASREGYCITRCQNAQQQQQPASTQVHHLLDSFVSDEARQKSRDCCTGLATCCGRHQQRTSSRLRHQRHRRRSHRHQHLLRPSSDEEDQHHGYLFQQQQLKSIGSQELQIATTNRKNESERKEAKYSSDIALNYKANGLTTNQLLNQKLRGKTLANGLASTDLRALVESRRMTIQQSDNNQIEKRLRPSSVCALASSNESAEAGACPPDALIGAQMMSDPVTEASSFKPQLKRSSPNGSMRSQASRATRTSRSGKLTTTLKKNRIATPKVSLLQLRNLVRKRAAARAAAETQDDQQQSSTTVEGNSAKELEDKEGSTKDKNALDVSAAASCGGRRQERQVKKMQQPEAAKDEVQHLVVMRAINGTRLLQTRPLAPLDDSTQLYAIPKKNSTELKTKLRAGQLHQQQQVADEQQTLHKANEQPSVGPELTALDDGARSGSSPIASSWDDCVDLVVSSTSSSSKNQLQSASHASPAATTAANNANKDEETQIGDSLQVATQNLGSRSSLEVDSIPGYSVVRKQQHVADVTSDACLCSSVAKENSSQLKTTTILVVNGKDSGSTNRGPDTEEGSNSSSQTKEKKSWFSKLKRQQQQTQTKQTKAEISQKLQDAENYCPPKKSTSETKTIHGGNLLIQDDNSDTNLPHNGTGSEQEPKEELIRPKSVLSATSAELIKAHKNLATAAAAKVQRDRMARMLRYHADAYDASSSSAASLLKSDQRQTPRSGLLTVRTNEPEAAAYWFSRSMASSSPSEQRRELFEACVAAATTKQQDAKMLAMTVQPNHGNSAHWSGNNSVGVSDSSPSNNGAESDNSMQNSASSSTATAIDGQPQLEASDGTEKQNGNKSEQKSIPLGGILSRILLPNGNSRKRAPQVAEARSLVAAGNNNGGPKCFNSSISSTSSPISSSSPSVNSNNRSPLTLVGGETAATSMAENSSISESQSATNLANEASKPLDHLGGSRSRRPIVLSRSSELQDSSAAIRINRNETADNENEDEARIKNNQLNFGTQVAMNGLPRVSSYNNIEFSQQQHQHPRLKAMNGLSEVNGDSLEKQIRMQANLCNYHNSLNQCQSMQSKYNAYLPYAVNRYSTEDQCDPSSANRFFESTQQQVYAPESYISQHYGGATYEQKPHSNVFGQRQDFYAGDDSAIYIPASYVRAQKESSAEENRTIFDGTDHRKSLMDGNHAQAGLAYLHHHHHHAITHSNSGCFVGNNQHRQQQTMRPKSSLDSILINHSAVSHADNKQQVSNNYNNLNGQRQSCLSANLETEVKKTTSTNGTNSSYHCRDSHETRSLATSASHSSANMKTLRNGQDFEYAIDQNSIYAPGSRSMLAHQYQCSINDQNTSGSSMTTTHSSSSQLTVLPADNESDKWTGPVAVRLTYDVSAKELCEESVEEKVIPKMAEIKSGKLTRVSIGSNSNGFINYAQSNGSKLAVKPIECQHNSELRDRQNALQEDEDEDGATVL